MGKTRHLPGPGIWHLLNYWYEIANLKKHLGMKSFKIPFCPVQNIVCPPQKTVLRTPMLLEVIILIIYKEEKYFHKINPLVYYGLFK